LVRVQFFAVSHMALSQPVAVIRRQMPHERSYVGERSDGQTSVATMAMLVDTAEFLKAIAKMLEDAEERVMASGCVYLQTRAPNLDGASGKLRNAKGGFGRPFSCLSSAFTVADAPHLPTNSMR
jgi:hypothetical protein